MAKSLLSPKRAAKYYWLRLIRLRGNPFVIARGLAIGTFIGITPTIPLHTILTIFLCSIFRGNMLAAIIANWIVSNPLTIPIEYYLSWRIGTIITSRSVSWDEVQIMLTQIESTDFLHGVQLIFNKFLEVIYCLVIGGVVLALPIGFLCYFIAVYFYFYRQKKRQEEFLERISKSQTNK